MMNDIGDPNDYQEAILNVDKEKWLKVMQEDINSLHENHTFEFVEFY